MIYIVTFATTSYKSILLEFLKSFRGTKYTIIVYDENSECVRSHFENSEIPTNTRGYGYMSWKPVIISDAMNLAKPEDLIVYVDVDLHLKDRHNFHKLLVNAYRLSSQKAGCFAYVGEYFEKGYYELSYTSEGCIDFMSVHDSRYTYDMTDCYQFMSGFQIWKVNREAKELLDEYLDFCCILDCVSDFGDVKHRHDQSVLSVILNSVYFDFEIIADPTQYGKTSEGHIECFDNTNMTYYGKSIGPSVAVIIPTIGTDYFKRAFDSVMNQTYSNITVYTCIDGEEYLKKTESMLSRSGMIYRNLIVPFDKNTGANNWNGHKIYYYLTMNVSEDYVVFLDEDNWFEENHIADMIENLDSEKIWCYSLRNLYKDYQGLKGNPVFIGVDTKESIGANNFGYTLVDTSCYLIKTEIARSINYLWLSPTKIGTHEPDREIARVLLSKYPRAPKSSPTVNYLLTKGHSLYNNHLSVTDKPPLKVFFFDANQTLNFFDNNTGNPYDEYQKTLLLGLYKHYNLYHYNCNIKAPGLFIFCNITDSLITAINLNYTYKILLTVESPALKSKILWTDTILRNFDLVYTFSPQLVSKPFAEYCPFIYRLPDGNIEDYLVYNKNIEKKICMVLENRKNNEEYSINNVNLKCLDYLRSEYSNALGDLIKVWGSGHTGSNVVCSLSRFDSDNKYRSVLDIYKKFTFCLIIENCNADGYISEKIFDAMVAGCIPIYYSEHSTRPVFPGVIMTSSPGQLIEKLNSLTKKDIISLKDQIRSSRLQILKDRSPDYFADKLSRRHSLQRILLSTTVDSVYFQFVNKTCRAWLDLGYLVTLFIVYSEDQSEMLSVLYNQIDIDSNLTIIKTIHSQPIPASQMIRLFGYSMYKDSTCMMSDIDMLPLDGNYFKLCNEYHEKLTVVYRPFEYIHEGINNEYYKYQIPICYVAHKGPLDDSSTFDEFFDRHFTGSWDSDQHVLKKLLSNFNIIKLKDSETGFLRKDRTIQDYPGVKFTDYHMVRPSYFVYYGNYSGFWYKSDYSVYIRNPDKLNLFGYTFETYIYSMDRSGITVLYLDSTEDGESIKEHPHITLCENGTSENYIVRNNSPAVTGRLKSDYSKVYSNLCARRMDIAECLINIKNKDTTETLYRNEYGEYYPSDVVARVIAYDTRPKIVYRHSEIPFYNYQGNSNIFQIVEQYLLHSKRELFFTCMFNVSMDSVKEFSNHCIVLAICVKNINQVYFKNVLAEMYGNYDHDSFEYTAKSVGEIDNVVFVLTEIKPERESTDTFHVSEGELARRSGLTFLSGNTHLLTLFSLCDIKELLLSDKKVFLKDVTQRMFNFPAGSTGYFYLGGKKFIR